MSDLFRLVENVGPPEAIMQCTACGEGFYVDPSTEDGLYLGTDKVLRIECPSCGLKEPE